MSDNTPWTPGRVETHYYQTRKVYRLYRLRRAAWFCGSAFVAACLIVEITIRLGFLPDVRAMMGG
ncbi:MAG: hypothetical protein VX464_20850 [Pseudomonadota bacterium]|nr:hypothetical protein [Pseudomonadota bacterium]